MEMNCGKGNIEIFGQWTILQITEKGNNSFEKLFQNRSDKFSFTKSIYFNTYYCSMVNCKVISRDTL